jgi:D-glycero-alpha-D-manno-heptose 1-phosphate guanylyltransferase
MEAIILAGGMGTRLREVIEDIPKPMAPVNGKPFLQYLFEWLADYPVKKVIISAGYKSESIIGYFGGSFMDLPISYIIEEKPLGTGGAIMFSLPETSDENILILNGDTFFPVDLARFYKSHCDNNNRLTIALKRMKDFSRYGSVECRGDTIIKFNEKKFRSEGLINGGIYMVNRGFLESRQLPGSFSLEKEILEKEAGSSLIKCMIFNDTFIDIGIPEDYLRAASVLKSNRY